MLWEPEYIPHLEGLSVALLARSRSIHDINFPSIWVSRLKRPEEIKPQTKSVEAVSGLQAEDRKYLPL